MFHFLVLAVFTKTVFTFSGVVVVTRSVFSLFVFELRLDLYDFRDSVVVVNLFAVVVDCVVVVVVFRNDFCTFVGRT